MSRIRVNIDRIAIRGMDPVQRRALVEGLEAELSRILADPAVRAAAAKARRTPVLRLAGVPLAAGSPGGRRVGVGIARAIGRSMSP
jgi:hypothetical protein